ncbi:MAG TPA: hypothetical protein VGW76_12375 [Pyrinomonadaceae bacterium]|nr:hypothetical protein [Pyrinomonadaceae bacterium]
MGKALENIGSTLKYGYPLLQETDLTVLDAEKLRTHSAELDATFNRLRELESQLAELGLTPKPPER